MLRTSSECYGTFEDPSPTLTIDFGGDQHLPPFELGIVFSIFDVSGSGRGGDRGLHGHDADEQRMRKAEDKLATVPIHAAAAEAAAEERWREYVAKRDGPAPGQQPAAPTS